MAVKKKKVAKKAAKKVVKEKVAKKAVKKVAKKGAKLIRYNDAQRKQILDHIASVNKQNGKGGKAAAIRRFKVTAITINRWINKISKKK